MLSHDNVVQVVASTNSSSIGGVVVVVVVAVQVSMQLHKNFFKHWDSMFIS